MLGLPVTLLFTLTVSSVSQQSERTSLWKAVLLLLYFFPHFVATRQNIRNRLYTMNVQLNQTSSAQNIQQRPRKKVCTIHPHTLGLGIWWEEIWVQHYITFLSSSPAPIRTSCRQTGWYINLSIPHKHTHPPSPCYTDKALLKAYIRTYIHRAAFYLQNTQWNDSSNPKGGFTDSKDTVSQMADAAGEGSGDGRLEGCLEGWRKLA